MKSAEHRWDQLIEEGYCLFEGVLDGIMLERLRQVTDWLLDAQTAEDSAAQRSTGSMISVWEDHLFARVGQLSALPGSAALARVPASEVLLRVCHRQTASQPGAVLAPGLVGVG